MAMTKLTEGEWGVMEVLWEKGPQQLGQIVEALADTSGWSRTTVHTYLTRMEHKGLIADDGGSPRHYRPCISRSDCARRERQELVDRIYGGSAAKLVTAFVQDGSLTAAERDRLRKLLDEMEV